MRIFYDSGLLLEVQYLASSGGTEWINEEENGENHHVPKEEVLAAI